MAELTLDKIKFKKADEKPCQITFSVNVPKELVAAKEDEVAREYQKVAQLPGFRAGKAPAELIRKNFGGKVKNAALEDLLKAAVSRILDENKTLMPITTPMVDKLEFKDGNALNFNVIIERNPEFKVKGYTKIPLEKKVKAIGDAEVLKELDDLRERNSHLAASKDEAVGKNHFVAVDFAGTLDGKALPELKGENQLINMAAPQTIQGFAEGIVGAARNETREVSVDFPKEYPNKKMAGQKVIFKITVKDIKEKAVPALDDEFAKDLGLASLAELKAKIQESLKSWTEKNQRAELEKQAYDYLVKENEIPVPESLVAMQLENMVDQALANQPANGADMEKKRAEGREKLKSSAERQVRLSYLVSRIAKDENLKATDEDVRLEMEKAEKSNPGRAKEVQNYFAENHTRIVNQITEEKVLNFLISQAKVKEVAG